MQEKYVTKTYLNQTLNKRFDKFGKLIDSKFDDFARIMKNSFDEMRVEMHGLFGHLKSDLSQVRQELHFVKLDTEDIKLRLDQKADRFELRVLERKVDKHIAEHRKSTR